MGAVQTKTSRLASNNANLSTSRPPNIQSREVPTREPRAFPEASARLALPTSIRDEMLELYAFIFCQRGFHQIGMTFEQFLLVAASIKPADLPATRAEE